MHTDAIITKNGKSAKKFLKEVKSSISMHNTSTQFADGGEFGFGVRSEYQLIHFHLEGL
jgi:glutamate-5-semialdehyde dehydrogenase